RGGGRMSVGIERLAVYVPAYALKLEDLAAARGVAPEKYRDGLGLGEMALVPPCEDVVTLAATAGARLIGAAHLDPAQIGMLLVATETPVDHAKPVASFVHGLLGLSSHCRVWDLTHACYAGTAALMTAADWVRAGGHRVRRALVIAADIARYPLGSPGEPTQGAGAVAMLVDAEPQALVDGQYSIACYLEALTGAFTAFRALERPPFEPGEAFTDRVAHLLYHSPFPKMAAKAHRRLVEIDWRAAPGRVVEDLDAAAAASFRELVAPGLEAIARVGNCYTASLYFCLAALLEAQGRRLGGRRLGLFSYGSGSCAEFFSGLVPASVAAVSDAGVAASLARRTYVDVAEYERLARAPETGGDPPPGFAGAFIFEGVRGEQRRYARVGL